MDYKKLFLDYWNAHKDDAEYQEIVNEESFWFKRASELIEAWKNYNISEERIDSLLSMEYEDIKNSSDEEISKIRELLFELIAYCDAKANKKEQYNPSLRTVAKSGVRQNNWVKNLLRWRKSGTASTSVYNAIKYLSNPQSNLTMLSENHRKKFSSEVLQKAYDPDNFCTEVITWMDTVIPAVDLKSDDNRTWLYCKLIYANEDKWLPSNVLGVIARDAGDWQEECCNHEYVALGWDQVSRFGELKDDLKDRIEADGSFPFYNVANNETKYYGDVVDFVSSDEEYQECVEEWKEKNPASFCETFSQYGQSGKPAVVFLVRDLKKMERGYDISQFKFYADVKPGRRNMVAYTKILSENHSGEKMKDELLILQNKKNIILQGAPGTGKTYKTAELALSICDETVPSNHKDVMIRYNQLVEQGRIGFVTFHQSMDYEDFVEGYKPKTDDGQVIYEIEDGIFKTICKNASGIENKEGYSDKIDFKKARIFKMSLGEKGKNDTEIFDYCFENNVVALGWGGVNDFSKCKTREDFRAKDSTWGATAVEIFKEWMQNGDVILISDGTKAVKAIAQIVGDYEYHNDCPIDMCQYRRVKWLYSGESIPISKLYDKNLSQQTIYAFGTRDEKGNVENGTIKIDVLNDIITGNLEKETSQNYVLIIDEINRGNVSKIFGELISLLEADKRSGGNHPLSVTLPYTKKTFSVPSNLYIIGTMNTTDRSVGSIDYAVRRRFAFVTLEANEILVPEGAARNLFNAVKNFLNESKYDMDIEDLMVGHSYFMDDKNLQMKWRYEILPLLMEYHKDGIISKSPLKDQSDKEIANVKKDYTPFITAWKKEI